MSKSGVCVFLFEDTVLNVYVDWLTLSPWPTVTGWPEVSDSFSGKHGA